MSSYFKPPSPAYSNPPIEPQYFSPDAFVITAIKFGTTTTVTVAPTFYGSSNNYVIGQSVRLVIPRFYGAQELNNQVGFVIHIPVPSQFTLNINSIGFTPFIPKPAYGPTPPQSVPVGDVNTGVINTGRSGNGTFIPGSFINISNQ